MDIRRFFGPGKAISSNCTQGLSEQKKCEIITKDSSAKKESSKSKKKSESSRSKKNLNNTQNISDAGQDSFAKLEDLEKIDFGKILKSNEDNRMTNKNIITTDSMVTPYFGDTLNINKNNVKIPKSSKDPRKREILKRKLEIDELDEVQVHKPKKRKDTKEFDSESEEDYLQASKKEISQSEGKRNEKFTQVIPKSSTFNEVDKKKKVIDPSEFFGCSPVQRSKSRHFNAKAGTDLIEFHDETNEHLNLSKKLSSSKRKKEDEEHHLENSEPTVKKCPQYKSVQLEGKNAFVHPSDPETDIAMSAKKAEDRRKSYLTFRNREPPKSVGLKDIPEGQNNCFEGLTFVLTGICESIDRDDCKSLIEKYGGKVTTNVSRNTKYVVVGRDAGESKLAKAKELKTKQIDEDGLFELLRNLPGKKSKYEIEAEKAGIKKPLKTENMGNVKIETFSKQESMKTEPFKTKPSPTITPTHSELKDAGSDSKSLLWVDKYKPTSMKNIIGQQGEKSQAKKLYNWLLNWHKNINKKPIFGRPSEDGCGFKAALLSGPPGIGKTTTAHLVCQDSGFSFFELNASDTRSKKSLKEVVSEALNCHSLFGFFDNKDGDKTLDGKKHCLVMDEVDGMAGNEDRGGVQEMIQLIKTSHIPIICMCNDRNHPKIRSLANYCFDLRFQKPRLEQIKGSMMSIVFKEGLNIPASALNEVIQAANQDIRQVIHNLCMWSVKDKNLTYEQLKQDAARAQKDQHFSPFDVCRKVFSDDSRKMTLNDKSDLFFHDYNISPLFVQENYVSVRPYNAQSDSWKHLKLLGEAANSMSVGDLVDGYVRKNQQWGLLPTQAMFSSVIPGECVRGSFSSMIAFPSWLGKNSTTNKNNRLLQELSLHTSLSASCNKQSLNLDYLPAMKHLLVLPLIRDGSNGVGCVVSIMDKYNLLREDFDNVLEITGWSNQKDIISQVDSKVKAAFTRAYNKESHVLPYSNIVIKKSKKGGSMSDEFIDGEEEGIIEGNEINEEEDDVTADAMIKVKKSSKARSANVKTSSISEPKKGKPVPKKSKK